MVFSQHVDGLHLSKTRLDQVNIQFVNEKVPSTDDNIIEVAFVCPAFTFIPVLVHQ